MPFEQLMDVQVTVEVASLFEEDERVVGSSVSRVTPEQWNRMGARRTIDAFEGQTGMVNYTYAGGGQLLVIRGFASNNSPTSVSWLLDGIPTTRLSNGFPYLFTSWELRTLDRVEMIKGPGSAIYGSDAFHGVVSLKTFESETDQVYVEGAGAWPEYGDLSFKLSEGFADNKYRIDATGSFSHQGDLDIDYRYEDPGSFGLPAENGTGTRKYAYDSGAGVIKATARLTDRLTLKGGVYLNKNDREDHASIARTIYHLRDADTWSQEATFHMAKSSATLDLGNQITAEAVGYYWESETIALVDYPEDYYVYFAGVNPALAFSRGRFTFKDQSAGTDITIKQQDNDWHLQWLAGYSYKHLKVPKHTSQLKLYPSGEWVDSYLEAEPGIAGADGKSRDIHGFFSQLKWGLLDNSLYLLAGGRYDRYSDFGSQFTPRAGLIFLPSDDITLKALYGQAFRAPSGIEMTRLATTVRGSEDLDPETIDTYELVFIQQKKEWKLTLNGFYSYWKDGIVRIPNPDYDPLGPATIENAPLLYANEGKNQSYGFEANLNYRFQPFGVDFGFAWVKSEALDRADPVDSSRTVDLDYDAYPEYAFKLGLSYFLEPCGVTFYLNNLLYLEWKEYPSYLATAQRSPEDLDPFWRTDLNIHKSVTDKMDVWLDIRNLFDRENFKPSIFGMEYGIEEPGISVLLRVGYRI